MFHVLNVDDARLAPAYRGGHFELVDESDCEVMQELVNLAKGEQRTALFDGGSIDSVDGKVRELSAPPKLYMLELLCDLLENEVCGGDCEHVITEWWYTCDRSKKRALESTLHVAGEPFVCLDLIRRFDDFVHVLGNDNGFWRRSDNLLHCTFECYLGGTSTTVGENTRIQELYKGVKLHRIVKGRKKNKGNTVVVDILLDTADKMNVVLGDDVSFIHSDKYDQVAWRVTYDLFLTDSKLNSIFVDSPNMFWGDDAYCFRGCWNVVLINYLKIEKLLIPNDASDLSGANVVRILKDEKRSVDNVLDWLIGRGFNSDYVGLAKRTFYYWLQIVGVSPQKSEFPNGFCRTLYGEYSSAAYIESEFIMVPYIHGGSFGDMITCDLDKNAYRIVGECLVSADRNLSNQECDLLNHTSYTTRVIF